MSTKTPKKNRRNRSGSEAQTTPPSIPDTTYRYHRRHTGVGCWINYISLSPIESGEDAQHSYGDKYEKLSERYSHLMNEYGN